MRISGILFLVIAGLSVCAQSPILRVVDGRYQYIEIVAQDSTPKVELYNRGEHWVNKTYNSPKEVIQVANKETGEISTAGIFRPAFFSRKPIISYNLYLSFKDNKYRYEISNFRYIDAEKEFNLENFPKAWAGKKKLEKSIDDDVQALIASLKNAMSQPKEDW